MRRSDVQNPRRQCGILTGSMRTFVVLAACVAACAAVPTAPPVRRAAHGGASMETPWAAQLGPRPKYLVDDMASSDLKDELQACLDSGMEYWPHDFSIGCDNCN